MTLFDRAVLPPPGKSGWPWTTESCDNPVKFSETKKWPRISIVTPTLNQGHFIEKTIRSVLLQGYPNLEYIIIDGGSNDCTIDIIKKYENWITYWESEKDNGQIHAINKGFSRASGDILAWINSDDGYYPGALYHVDKCNTEEDEFVALVGTCNRISKDEILSVVTPFGLTIDKIANWSISGFFYQPACFIMRQAWENAGQFDENLYCAFDLDYWLRLMKIGSFKVIDETVSWATIHPQAKTIAYRPLMQSETIIVQARHGYETLAIQRLEKLINEKELLATKIGRLTNNRFYRCIRPLFKKLIEY